MAGHSKWANIKHKKAKLDARRGKAWSKCARAIIVAAKNGGGDPATNLTLRYAIEDAKRANMPKDTIENAIKKGTGELGSESYESAMYEGYGPAGVAIMLEILTDNRNRTAGEIRKIFEKGGGNLGSTGCVAYLFTPRGQVFVSKQVDEDTLTAAVLEAGAEDVIDDEDAWQVVCEPSDLTAVREAIEKANLPIESAGVNMLPTTTVTCTGEDARRVLALIEALEDHDDVQKVHSNFEIPDEEMAALSEA